MIGNKGQNSVFKPDILEPGRPKCLILNMDSMISKL